MSSNDKPTREDPPGVAPKRFPRMNVLLSDIQSEGTVSESRMAWPVELIVVYA
jgi:hypothetical protein